MILTHVPRIGVALTEELFTTLSLVTTLTNASNPNVTQLKDVSTLELIVTITTHVPLTNVLKEYVSTPQLPTQLLMHVLCPAVIHLMENVYLPKRTVMTMMHVPQTLAILLLETVSTDQSLAKMVTDVPKTDVTLLEDVFMKRLVVMIKTHVLLTLVTQFPDVSTLL